MNAILHPYEVTQEEEMLEPLDFNRRSRLKDVDKCFKAEVTNVIRLTEMEKLFQLRMINEDDKNRFTFLPGQFVMVELPGYGEVPISISCSPSIKSSIELCIRKAGKVTEALHKAKRGAIIGIRGPFGTHFPMEQMKKHNVLLIAGGLGLAPLRAPMAYVLRRQRSDPAPV
jgi:sulfhydrogenase subunit gamma (sulfur reductase)